jgi:hypothetical protein
MCGAREDLKLHFGCVKYLMMLKYSVLGASLIVADICV